jgi:hypothetical protein
VIFFRLNNEQGTYERKICKNIKYRALNKTKMISAERRSNALRFQLIGLYLDIEIGSWIKL